MSLASNEGAIPRRSANWVSPPSSSAAACSNFSNFTEVEVIDRPK
jgi:hypothetical protein